MSEPKIRTKTFVAECIDGPRAGQLQRWPEGFHTLSVGTAQGRRAIYRLVVRNDGIRVWQFKDYGA